MKTWFTSLNGAVTLSVLALLTLLGYTSLFAMFVLPDEMGVSQDQPATVALFILWAMAPFGGWVWALLAAVRGGRIGLIVTLIFSLLSALMGGFSLLVYCAAPKGCVAWPVGDITVWVELITGLAASVALGLQLSAGRER